MHNIKFHGGERFASPFMRTLVDGDHRRTLAIPHGATFQVTDQELWGLRDQLGHGFSLVTGKGEEEVIIDPEHARFNINAAGKPPDSAPGSFPKSKFEVAQPGTAVPAGEDLPPQLDWSPGWTGEKNKGPRRAAAPGENEEGKKSAAHRKAEADAETAKADAEAATAKRTPHVVHTKK